MKEHEVRIFSINDCAAEFAIKGIAATTLPAAQTGYTKDIDPTQIPLDPLNTAIQAHILLPESLSINCCDWILRVGLEIPLRSVGTTRSAFLIQTSSRLVQGIFVVSSLREQPQTKTFNTATGDASVQFTKSERIVNALRRIDLQFR